MKSPLGGETTVATAVHDRDGRRSPGVHATLSVLEALVTQPSLTLSDLATQLNLPKSSVHRVCSVLVDRGWLARNVDGRFGLGIRAFGLSPRTAEYPLVRAFRGIAAELLTRHNETVCLAVLEGDESAYIALEETSQPVRLVTQVGSRTPAFAAASGRVILADRAPQVIAAEYAGQALVTPTGRRLKGVEELLTILRKIRRDGYAENDEETAAGLYVASVPIRNAANAVLAALTMCIPTSRVTSARRERILADLQDAGRHLSGAVAYLPAWNALRADAAGLQEIGG